MTQEQMETMLRDIVKRLDYVFNGQVGGPGREVGFVLLTFPFNDRSGRCNYASNGADRQDMVVLFKETIAHLQGQPDNIQGHA